MVDAPVADFAAKLRGLRTIVGEPSYGSLAALTKRTGWPQHKSTIHDKLAGRSVASEQFVTAFVLACRAFAAQHGRTLLEDQADPARWRQECAAVRRETALIRAARRAAIRDSGVSASARHPDPGRPESSAERERELLVRYLDALCSEIRILRPGRIINSNLPLELALDEIYVELQAEPDHPDVDRRVTLQELAEARKQAENWTWEDPQERERQYRIFANLDRSFREGASAGTTVTLATVVQRHDRVVILGDPGSGKTTLLRYLAVQSARAILASREPRPPLFPVPIYVRISEYAEFRARVNPDSALRDYLSHYISGLQVPCPGDVSALLNRCLEEGRCLVLLDGLDEVIEDWDRANVARAITQFAAVFSGRQPPGGGGQPLNKFVVTSRIAGYRPFVELPSSFAHYTIRPLNAEQIGSFLDRWCRAVERHLQPHAEPHAIEQKTAEERSLILEAIERSPGVRRLADNPLLLRVLAMLHKAEGRLPQRRAELYQKATRMLLWEWNLERLAPKEVAIDEFMALSLLGPVAMHIHTRQPSGLLSPGQTMQLLFGIRGPQRGDPPGAPSVETIKDVTKFLKTVREHSGLFVERGTGLFGFMHLTFQEYFVARYLIRDRSGTIGEIKARLHQPRWREPILLAIASLTETFSGDIDGTLQMILEAGNDHEAILHRDLLFAADCVGDCGGVFPMRRKDISRRLISVYRDARGGGRYALLQRQIRDALLILNDSTDSWAVEAALAEELALCHEADALSRAVELADLLNAHTTPVIRALERASVLLPEARQALARARSRVLSAGGVGGAPGPTARGWKDYAGDRILTQLIGALWLYGWQDFLELAMGTCGELAACAVPAAEGEAGSSIAVTRLRQLGWYLEACVPHRRENLTTVLSELDQIGRELGTAATGTDRPDVADLVVKVRNWYGSLARRVSNLTLASVLNAVAEAAWNLPGLDADTPQAPLIGHLLSGVNLLRRGRRFTSGQAVRFRATERLLVSRPELSQMAATLAGIWEGHPGDPVAGHAYVESLASVTDRLENMLGTELPDHLARWGEAVLMQAQAGDAVATAVADALRRAAPLAPAPDSDGWRSMAEAAGAAMTDVLTDGLRNSTEPQQYVEAAFLLAWADQLGAGTTALPSIVRADLDGEGSHRRLLALGALRHPIVRLVALDDGECGLLTDLADRHADLAGSALDVLFAADLSPALLTWCWAQLRTPGTALSSMVLSRLNAVRAVDGTAPMLQLLDDGLTGDGTRAPARDLLSKLTWTGLESYTWCLHWLGSADPDTRGIAATLLARGERLFDVPRSILRTAILAQLEPAIGLPQMSWSALRDDPDAVRLLQGLWGHGWRDALVTLWMDEPAQSYLSRNHPDWATAEQEDTICSVLEQARFGQALIPVLVEAAARLAGWRPAGETAERGPSGRDIAMVEREIVQELDGLTDKSDEPARTPLHVDAAILQAALRSWPVPRPSGTALRQMLADAPDDGTWSWAATRLAWIPEQLDVARDAVATAMVAAGPRRRAAALLVLLANPPLYTAMRDAVAEQLRRCDHDAGPGLLYACLLVATNADDGSARAWLRATVSPRTGDGPEDLAASAAALAQRMLPSLRPQGRAVAAALLLSEDLYALLLPVLAQAAQSGNDRLRWAAGSGLHALCSELPTEGSTAAVDWLQRRMTGLDTYGQSREGTGREVTILMEAAARIRYTHLYWVKRWMTTIDLDGGDKQECRHAGAALTRICLASDEVSNWICARITGAGSSEVVRRAAVFALAGMRHESPAWMEDAKITAALLAALSDTAATVRRAGAFALQWTGHEIRAVGTALLERARSDPDQETRSLALISLGRFLRRAHPDPADTAADIFLEPMRALLGAADPATSRAAAIGIAAAIEARDDATAMLSSILPDPPAVLTAMLLAAADEDFWVEEEPSHHVAAAGRIAAWAYEQPERERSQLIDRMLADLERAAEGMEEHQQEDIFAGYLPEWCTRRIITGVLAELSERLTFHSFTGSRPLAAVVALFARVARDPDSFSARRLSLKILGNLQQFTPEVATAFFEACQDTSIVFRDSKAVIRKFNEFTPGSLEKLTQALFEPGYDALVAYRAATLLGALGIGRSDELGRSGRSRISDELARLLRDPLASRTAVEPVGTEYIHLQTVGPVYDAVYEALIRVVAGPDAPETQPGEAEPVAAGDGAQNTAESAPELQEILRQLEPDSLSASDDEDQPRVRVFWQATGPCRRYCIAIYNDNRWVDTVTYAAADGYHQFLLRPLQDGVLSADNLIVIGAEDDLPRPLSRTSPLLPAMIRDDARMRLIYGDVFTSDVIIGIPDTISADPSPVRTGESLRIALETSGGTALDAADVVIGRENDLYVSFPHWLGAIEKVSYTLDDDRLNVIVVPTDEGMKLGKADVMFTQGIGYAGLPRPDTAKLQRRKGRGAVKLIVSLPYQEGTVEKVSYRLDDNLLHIIVKASESFWPVDFTEVVFSTASTAEPRD